MGRNYDVHDDRSWSVTLCHSRSCWFGFTVSLFETPRVNLLLDSNYCFQQVYEVRIRFGKSCRHFPFQWLVGFGAPGLGWPRIKAGMTWSKLQLYQQVRLAVGFESKQRSIRMISVACFTIIKRWKQRNCNFEEPSVKFNRRKSISHSPAGVRLLPASMAIYDTSFWSYIPSPRNRTFVQSHL